MTWPESGFLQPEAVLPPQFFGALRRQAPLKTAEVQLLIALLEDAINWFRDHARAGDRAGQRLFRDAEQWIMAERQDGEFPRDSPFSFHYLLVPRRTLQDASHGGMAACNA